MTFEMIPTILWRRGLLETPRTRGASGGEHRRVCPCANLVLLFGAGGSLYHRCRVAAIIMCNGGGCSRLSIGRMVNPKNCVMSDPTSIKTINGTQAKSTSTTVCAPQVPLGITLGTSVKVGGLGHTYAFFPHERCECWPWVYFLHLWAPHGGAQCIEKQTSHSCGEYANFWFMGTPRLKVFAYKILAN